MHEQIDLFDKIVLIRKRLFKHIETQDVHNVFIKILFPPYFNELVQIF